MLLPLIPFDVEVEVGLFRRGRLVGSTIQKAHSPVRNWVKAIKAFYEQGSETIVDITGTERTLYGYDYGYCDGGYTNTGIRLSAYAGDNDDSYGILAGKSTNPVSPDDYALGAKYPQGTGEGYLDYNAVEVPPIEEGEVTINDKTYKYMKLTVSRPVLNNADVEQTIYEVGLALYYYHPRVTDFKFLAFRDVLDTPLTIPAGETGVLRYHFRWLIPV